MCDILDIGQVALALVAIVEVWWVGGGWKTGI